MRQVSAKSLHPFFFLSPISHQPNLRVSSRMFKEHPVFKVCTVGRASERARLYYYGGLKKSRKFRSACRGNRCHLFVLPLLRFEGKPTGREKGGERERLCDPSSFTRWRTRIIIENWISGEKKSSFGLATFNRVKSIRRKVGGRKGF